MMITTKGRNALKVMIDLVYIYGRTSQSHGVIAGHLKVTLKSCKMSHRKQTFFAGNEMNANKMFVSFLRA